MEKMVITSFYNTLIDKEDAIALSTMLQIERLRKQGIKFAVITNRGVQELLEYNKDFPFIDYIIAFNGNIVYDLNNKVLLDNPLTKEEINTIEEKYKDRKLTYFKENNIYKIEIELKNKDLKNKDFLKINNLNTSIFKYNKKIFLEITSSKSNNLNSLKLLLKNNNINNENVKIIVGNESEIDIVKKLKNVYVVSNAKELKKYATNKTKSNNFKGVENVIKKIK